MYGMYECSKDDESTSVRMNVSGQWSRIWMRVRLKSEKDERREEGGRASFQERVVDKRPLRRGSRGGTVRKSRASMFIEHANDNDQEGAYVPPGKASYRILAVQA